MADRQQPDLLNFVRAHDRWRLGRLEHVRAYWRPARKPAPRRRAKRPVSPRVVIVFL